MIISVLEVSRIDFCFALIGLQVCRDPTEFSSTQPLTYCKVAFWQYNHGDMAKLSMTRLLTPWSALSILFRF